MIRIFFFLCLFIALKTAAQIYPLSDRVPHEDKGITQQSNEKIKWLLDGKYGMFIHWGLYSGPANGEWYMNWAGIPIDEYRKFAYPESGDKQFVADKFNADEWAKLAKEGGMRYMNLTTMHHDGFALFESNFPNAFTAKQTLGRDLVREYADACRRAGLRVGIYKTLINWRYPGYYDIDGTGKSPFFKSTTKWGYKADASHKENARLMKDELFYQTKELMTKYGKIDQIFWDGGWLGEKGTDADAAFFWEPGKYRDPENQWPVSNGSGDVDESGRPLGLMGMVRKYQPGILVNPRSGWYGDYFSEEGASPITGPVRSAQVYEKTLSLHESWGYEKHAEDPTKILSADKVKRILSDCIIRNMALLLNVGPDRHGVIPKAEADVIREVGKWLGRVGEAVYETRGGPWNPKDGFFGYCYRDKTIFAYIYKDFKGDQFKFPSIDHRKVVRAYNVYDKKPLKFSLNDWNEITVTGIDRVQHPEVTVIALELDQSVLPVVAMEDIPTEYFDAKTFDVNGKGFDDNTYFRLPEKYKDVVRSDVWDLSRHSSGISIRFSTNSKKISVKWKTGNSVHYPHGAETMVKGVDLYCYDNNKWYYAGVGKPYSEVYNESVLIDGMDSAVKEFTLYLPMYETVDSVFIGVNRGSAIKKPGKALFQKKSPIVFYGTSITQGASAMRPGMAYSNILSRSLNIETINLGFSGNGKMEKELVDVLSEIDASVYVIDCGGNLTPQLARERTIPFIRLLKKLRPAVPVLLVEHVIFPTSRFVKSTKERIDSINYAFLEGYNTLKKEGVKGLYYLPAKDEIGDDGEATVDGAHFTDVGFMRISKQMEKILRVILNASKK
jgi:alpha-L-fucosidase